MHRDRVIVGRSRASPAEAGIGVGEEHQLLDPDQLAGTERDGAASGVVALQAQRIERAALAVDHVAAAEPRGAEEERIAPLAPGDEVVALAAIGEHRAVDFARGIEREVLAAAQDVGLEHHLRTRRDGRVARRDRIAVERSRNIAEAGVAAGEQDHLLDAGHVGAEAHPARIASLQTDLVARANAAIDTVDTTKCCAEVESVVPRAAYRGVVRALLQPEQIVPIAAVDSVGAGTAIERVRARAAE